MPASSSSLSVLAPVIGVGASPPVPLSAMESIRLVQALKAVPDPRRRRGRRHGLQSVLRLAVQAVMAGAGSWVAIAQWAPTAPQALGVCGAPPAASTFRGVLAAVDIPAVEAALTRWVIGRQARCRQQRPVGTTAAEARTVLAVDGKTLRGSRDGEGQRTKLVSVYDHARQLVLTQAPVLTGDELPTFSVALTNLLDLCGVLITADALHCQRAHAGFLEKRGGHYLFTVKGQPAAAARSAAATALGTRPRDPSPWPRTRSPRVPLGQGHRPGRYRRPGLGSARAPGGQGRPAATRRHRQAFRRGRLCDHLAGLPGRGPPVACAVAAGPLDHREPRPPSS